jgi:hypothetical protein
LYPRNVELQEFGRKLPWPNRDLFLLFAWSCEGIHEKSVSIACAPAEIGAEQLHRRRWTMLSVNKGLKLNAYKLSPWSLLVRTKLIQNY